MLMPTKALLNPTAIKVYNEKANALTNKMKSNHGAQPLLVKRPKATIKLRMPSNPSCGAKAVKGKNAKRIIPETA